MSEISSTNWLLAAIAGSILILAFAIVYFGSTREGRKRSK